jgi:hypothetical protein
MRALTAAWIAQTVIDDPTRQSKVRRPVRTRKKRFRRRSR